MSVETKLYRLCGVDSAIELIRPGAKWQMSNSKFTLWEDARPCPTMEELQEVMKKAQEFEDSLDVIWRPDQIKELTGRETLADS